MFGLGTPEIILIIVVLLLFFGKDKIPELARSVGRSFNELKNGFKDGTQADSSEKKDTSKK